MIPKFRAWDKKHKEMCEVMQIHFDLGFINCINEWIRNLYFDDCILMQSTGLKDKNGKEIFEGDILENTTQISYLGEKYKVKSEKYGSFILLNNKGLASNIPISESETSYELVGNIYENKELIENE